MKLRTTIPLVLVALAVAMMLVPNVVAASYVLTISPNTTVSLGTQMTMTLDLTGGSKNTAYSLVFEVVKPNGTGSASTTRVLTTDNRGVASTIVPYPDPSFTPTSGTVATDVGGVYNVIINQTAPTNIAPVATGQFTVSAQLTVVVSQPVGGIVVQRGGTVAISATVSSISGADTLATVWTYSPSPSNAKIYLTQSGVGVYSSNYQVTTSDSTGPWTITVQAADTQGNSGQASPITISIAKNDLIVDSLVTYNSKGTPATTFSPGDTVYAFFRIRYSSGAYLTTGQYPIGLKNPSGVVVANLTASYDSSRFGFYTATGYPISTFASGGTWTAVVSANSINDGYGNTGPGLDTSVPLDITVSPLSYWPFIVAGIVAVLGGVVTMKRFDTTLEGFQHLEQLMGGPVPRGASVFLLGDAGSGKTILSYELLHEELETGKLCALLSYDAFPEDVQARMGEFGWDIVSPLRKGRLKIIDCYSGLAGQGEGAIKDPSDLTEMNIQVTAFIGKAKGGPVTVVLDSLTPIFNGVEEKQALNFIQTLGAKVKKTGGLFVLTASRGAIPDDSVAKIKTMTDGVIELSITRTHGKAHRYLSVLKMERRVISSGVAPFEINRSRGLVFRVSRFGILKKQLLNFFRVHHLSWPRLFADHGASSPAKASPNRQR